MANGAAVHGKIQDIEDELSQSNSDELSAPTEYLAEFLSAVLLKNYIKALEYCKLSKNITILWLHM